VARKTFWHDRLFSISVSTGAQSVTDLLTSLSQDETRGITIARTVIRLAMVSPTAVSDGSQALDIGLAMVSSDAFGAGAVPDPNVETDIPVNGWVFRTRVYVPGNANGPTDPTPVREDIRAMRKLSGAIYTLVANNTAQDGTAFSVRMIGIVRTLVLLP